MESITELSINKSFWLQFRPNYVNVCFEGLPPGVHFTLAFNQESRNINFHISRNTGDEKDKPYIRIIEIDKKLAEEMFPRLSFYVLFNMLEETDIENIRKKYKKINFFELKNEKFDSEIEKIITNEFRDISNLRKSKLKIKGDLTARMESIALSDKFQKIALGNIKRITKKNQNSLKEGIIFLNDNTLIGIRINERWFQIRKDITVDQIIFSSLNEDLKKSIKLHIMKSLIRIKNMNTRADSEPFNTPIRIIRRETV